MKLLRAIKCSRMMAVYDGMFPDGATKEDLALLRNVFYHNVEDPVLMPTRPPQGWEKFNAAIGGVPWYCPSRFELTVGAYWETLKDWYLSKKKNPCRR